MDEGEIEDIRNYYEAIFVITCMLVLDIEMIAFSTWAMTLLVTRGESVVGTMIASHVVLALGFILNIWILSFNAKFQLPQYEPPEIRETKYKHFEMLMRSTAWMVLGRGFLGAGLAIGSFVIGTKVVLEYASLCVTFIAHAYMPAGWWVLLRRAAEIDAWMRACVSADSVMLLSSSSSSWSEPTPPRKKSRKAKRVSETEEEESE